MFFTHPLVVTPGGEVHLPDPVALWLGHPSVVAGALLLLGAYLLVIGPFRTRFEGSAPVPPARVVSFTLGIAVMFVALTGPVHELGDCCLFSLHMVQHLMVTMLMPPLLLVGTPAWFFRALARLPVLGPLGRALTRPVPAFVLCNVFFAASHVIPVYDLQMRSHAFHITLHLAFMVTGVIMWWPVAAPADVPGWPRLPSPVALLYIFFQLVPASLLGAMIGYADKPLYRWYVAAPRVTGLSALDDQLLGALIMWVGGGFYWLGAITVVFFLWSRREEDEARGDSLRRDLTPVARR
jgi:putative membrane protein